MQPNHNLFSIFRIIFYTNPMAIIFWVEIERLNLDNKNISPSKISP